VLGGSAMLDESCPGRIPMPFRSGRIKRKVINATDLAMPRD